MTPAEKRARMKRGEGSPAARRPGGEPPTAGDGWGVSGRRLGGWERAAGRRVSSQISFLSAPHHMEHKFNFEHIKSSTLNNKFNLDVKCQHVSFLTSV